MDLNIIKAKFCNNKKSAWTDEQWQWDYGQILQFEGLELPEAYEVHFSNIAIGGESITQIGGENGVTIPDQFFTTGETIYAWVYLHQGEDDGETVYSVTIPIKKRPKPSDTPPTPQEQSAIDQAIAALNAAVEQTAEDVETTTENASQAAASAENAAASAEEASGYLEGVTAKANEAAASASAAEQSATTATEKAAETAAGVSRAEQAAEGAEAAKTAAQSAQAAAGGYAGAAGASAQAASTSATQAAGSATSASGFAGDANTSAHAAASSATTASTKATEAAQSASTASTAATNAINAKTAAETAQGKAEDAQEAAETAQEAAETAVESIQGKTEQIDQNTEDIGDLKAEINQLENDISTTVKSKNLIDPDKLTVGRLNSSGEIQTTMTNHYTSDYIPLEAGKTYVFARESLSAPGTALGTSYAGYGFYDAEKVWVANSRVYDNFPAGTVFTFTPQNDCYIRVTGATAYFTTDTVGKYIVQEGNALDGYEDYFAPYKVVTVLKKDDIVQTLGQSEDKLMSQKAVTDNTVGKQEFDAVLPYVVGKNKYNPTDCNPQNGKYYDSSGVVQSGAAYAITGKIPVEAETAYVFSTTLFSNTYTSVSYYSGSDGSTFISKESNNGAPFTTPANCTFIGINLFARGHTDQDFEDAIAIAQLEIGTAPTTYEPYEKKRMIYPSNIVGGDALDAVNDVTSVQSQINLYDKSLAMDGKYFNGSSGQILDGANYAFTGKIPVKPNTQYSISKDPSAPLGLISAVYCFDEYGNRVANASTLSNYIYGYLLSFSTASDVRFVAVNMTLNDHTTQDFEDTIDTLMLCVGTERPLEYSAYNPEPVVDADKLSDAYIANRKRFYGKKWLACGTSITWYDGKAYQAGVNTGEICRGYVGNVARRTGLLVTNEGISGSTLANISANSLINRYTTLDWANTDIATLEYGVNDFGQAVDVGTAEDVAGNTTFASCLKTVIEYALAQNPKICLVICTEPDVRNSPNSGGHYLSEYTEVTLAIAKQYRLPVCDWYYRSGINSLNKGDSTVDYLTADGTHPNDDGHMRMGAMLNQVFDSLIC